MHQLVIKRFQQYDECLSVEDISGISSLLDYSVNLTAAPQFANESYFFHSGSVGFMCVTE